MLRSILTAGMGTVLLTGVAGAADLPSRHAPPVLASVPVFTWTGFYAGVNAGGAWTSNDSVNTTASGAPGFVAIAQGQLTSGTVPVSHQLSQVGFVGGGQLGYNYQFGPGPTGVVAGVEADFDYVNLRDDDTIGAAFGTQDIYHAHLSYLGTARGRLGYAFDHVLVYATGGFAYGETGFAHTYLSNQTPPAAIFAGARQGLQTGYTIGGGVDYAIPGDAFNPFGSGAVTLGVEYLYYDLGTRTTTLNFVQAPTLNTHLLDRFQTAGNLVRAKLNFRFGDPVVAPVVARY